MTELNALWPKTDDFERLERFLGKANAKERELFSFAGIDLDGLKSKTVYRHINTQACIAVDADGNGYEWDGAGYTSRVPRRIALHRVRTAVPPVDMGHLATVIPISRVRSLRRRKPRPRAS